MLEKKETYVEFKFDYTGKQHVCDLLTPYFKIKSYIQY